MAYHVFIMKRPVLITLVLATVLVVAALGFKRVPAGHQALRVTGDGQIHSYGPGLHFTQPFSGRWLEYPAGLIERRFPEVGTYSLLGKNGGRAGAALSLRIDAPVGTAAAIREVVGDEFYPGLSRMIQDVVEIVTARYEVAADGAVPEGYRDAVVEEIVRTLAPAGLRVEAYRLEDWRVGAPVDGAATGDDALPEPLRKVIFVGVDGADWTILRGMMAQNRLPNFKRIVEGGASGPLRSIEPLLSPLLWTTMATGKLPEDHGILNFTVADPRTGKRVPVSRLSRKVDALWNMLSDYERTVSIVGWLATYPAESINGTMVTDRVGYLAYADAGDEEGISPGSASPPERLEEISSMVVRSRSVSYEEFKPFIHMDRETFLENRDLEFDPKNPINNMIMLYASTQSYRKIALDILDAGQPDFLAVYFELVDATKHLFMHYAPPRLPDTDDAKYRLFRDAVAQAYVLQDQILGELLEWCDERTVLIVVSDHGFKSGKLRPRLRPEIWAGKAAFWHKLDGIICVYGKGIRAGHHIAGASILDVAPTVLALQGLPRPADMPGRVLEAVMDETLVGRLNRTRVATLQRQREVDDLAGGTHDAASEQVLKKLEALAYITPAQPGGADSPDAHNNLGQRYQETGEYDKAVAEFNKALALRPNFPAALNNIGVCYGKLKRFELAEEALRRAIELNPEDVFAMNNLAIMFMQLGRFDDAREYGNRAITVEPNYANGHLTLGSIYANIGEFAEAEKEFMKALEIDPSNRNAQVNLERIRVDLKRN